MTTLSELCPDCGHRFPWKYGFIGGESIRYCKLCTRKNGHPIGVAIDPDVLEQIVGEPLARKILQEAQPSWDILW